ncbi:MAG: pilus assembly protein PilM [Planctomycetaceae bacterium]|nr:pilus assembly protein PilM [Planctomycetaceae bacterium]
MATIGDTEEAPATGLHCPRCRTTNPSPRKFCVKCGASLWETCLRCGEICTTGESYCGSCGVPLDEAAAERLEAIDAEFREATAHQTAGRYQQAQTILTHIAENEHPRLLERADRARRLAQQWTVERQRAEIGAENTLLEARRLFGEADYDAAARQLETVPDCLRNEAVAALFSEIALRRSQVSSLEQEMQTTLRERRLLDLPQQIASLLAVQPHHVRAQRLAQQLRNHLLTDAKRHLARCDYHVALQRMEAVVPLGETSGWESLRRRTGELSCLAWDLAHAPVIDPALCAAADRMRRLAPNDRKAEKLLEQLRRRAAADRDPRRIEPIRWARPPQSTPLGFPIDWCVGWRRIAAAESLERGMDRTVLRQNPGRFQIACGLALAALDRAALRINLLAAESHGLAERVAGLVRPKKRRGAWGIDLGTAALKAVRMTWPDEAQQPSLDTVAVFEYAKPLGQAVNDLEETRLISDAIDAFLHSRSVQGDVVCVGLPGRMAMCRWMDVPPVSPQKVRSLIEFETRLEVNLLLDQLLWDWGTLDATASRRGDPKLSAKNGCRALWVAVKRQAAERYQTMFRRLKLRVDLLQPDFIALHNFLAHEHQIADPTTAPAIQAVAALDVGCNATNIVVSSPRSFWFHSCGVAGHSFTRALVKEFGLSVAQAELTKRSPETADCLSQWQAAILPGLEDFAEEVRKSLNAYIAAEPDHPVRQIVGLGGGFSLHGLFRYLRCGR